MINVDDIKLTIDKTNDMKLYWCDLLLRSRDDSSSVGIATMDMALQGITICRKTIERCNDLIEKIEGSDKC